MALHNSKQKRLKLAKGQVLADQNSEQKHVQSSVTV